MLDQNSSTKLKILAFLDAHWAPGRSGVCKKKLKIWFSVAFQETLCVLNLFENFAICAFCRVRRFSELTPTFHIFSFSFPLICCVICPRWHNLSFVNNQPLFLLEIASHFPPKPFVSIFLNLQWKAIQCFDAREGELTDVFHLSSFHLILQMLFLVAVGNCIDWYSSNNNNMNKKIDLFTCNRNKHLNLNTKSWVKEKNVDI